MKFFGLLLLCLILGACHVQKPLVGGGEDAQGCLPGAGQSWSQLRQECLQLFEVADVRLEDSAHPGAAVYALLSLDRQQVELFASDIEGSLLLDAVKGGYRSADGRFALQQQNGLWRLRRALP